MNRTEIVTAIKAQLDELSDLGSADTDLIDSILDEQAIELMRIIPKDFMTPVVLVLSSPLGLRTGYADFALPGDFVRIDFIDEATLERPILELSPVTPDFYNPHLQPGVSRPRAIILNHEVTPVANKILRVSPDIGDRGLGSYFPETLPENMLEKAQYGLVFKAAAHVAGILEEQNAIAVLNSKFENWIKTL